MSIMSKATVEVLKVDVDMFALTKINDELESINQPLKK